MKYTTIINGEQYEIVINSDTSVTINGKTVEVDFLPMDKGLHSLITKDSSLELAIEEQEGNKFDVLLDGRLYESQVLDERSMLLLSRRGGLVMNSGEITSPMPGLIVAVKVAVGDTVEQGTTVVILESMKMQNELKAPRSGVVQEVHIVAGQSVDKNASLVIIGGDDEE